MAIDLNGLRAAGLETSKNDHLKKMWLWASEYNATPAGAIQRRLEYLDLIMSVAGEWLTSKRPTGTAKNNSRWNLMNSLNQQCAAEAQTLGAKQLTAPVDFRNTANDHANESYWLERVDWNHRPGFWLSDNYRAWLQAGHGSFWSWLPAAMPIAGGGKTAQVKMKEGAERHKYRIDYVGGKWVDFLNDEVSTQNQSTAFGGAGWAIFVLSPGGEFFVHSHKIGRFHHSSFLAGSAVAAAGEVCIDDGTIKMIMNKTGHYKAGVAEMHRMVQMLPQIDANALILPDLMRTLNVPPGTGEMRFHRVGDYRNTLNATAPLGKTAIRAALPAWAISARLTNLINRAPDP